MRAAAAELSRFPESKRIFLSDGKFYEPGETFAQPELARTLERIARRAPRISTKARQRACWPRTCSSTAD